ncbi:MAG: alpha/beta fold hydrolase [Acidimicrobiales bacterium]
MNFLTDDGLRISYQEWPEKAASRPLVILHHGFLADANSNWVGPGIVAGLVEGGRRVVGLDARGHGASEKPHDPAFYGEARMAADVRQLADHLGAESYDLIGYSMGAIVSLIVGATDPRVRRLAVGGVGGGVVHMGGLDTRVVNATSIAEALTAEDPEQIGDQVAKRFRMLADALGNDRLAVAAQARAAFRSPIAFEAITAPTLIYVGADDPLAAEPEALSAAIAGARLEILAGDHLTVLGDPNLTPLLVKHLTQP